MESEIYSVGIDVGTTTTQIIFSKFIIKNTAASFFIPRVEITEKKILYRSEIYFTPLIDRNTIDFNKLKEIVDKEFLKSGISKKDISTGAVIITGETARKENASEVSYTLSEFAGDFVVATAGPDLEAVFAGYGAGAYKLSKAYNSKVVNFDIGGGTTNACVFNYGEIEDNYALDIGGRLICFDNSGKVTYISSRINFLIEEMKLNIKLGEKPSMEALTKLCSRFAHMFLELAGFSELKEDTLKLFIAHVNKKLNIDFVTFSGGVSEYVYKNEEIISYEDIMRYGDIGPLLGYSIRKAFSDLKDKLLVSEEKIRATVIGAGNYSMTISGSTVVFDEEELPVKNIPIIKAFESEVENINNIYEKVKMRLSMYEDIPIALAFKGPDSPSYDEIKIMTAEIIKVFRNISGSIIVIVENDFAKALGQTIKNNIEKARKVICVDKIFTSNGDYIDIGKPVGDVVPVVVKTLIFKN